MCRKIQLSEDSELTRVKFDCGVEAAIRDLYCFNPDCNCADVTLEFIEYDETAKLKGRLFSFSLNTKTWKISNAKIENKALPCKEMLNEFKNCMTNELKDLYRERVAIAKESGEQNRMKQFDGEIMDGSCLGYAEVFGEEEIEKFCFDYNGAQYFVDDQYCVNPDCDCNEAILTFVRLMPGRRKQEPYFVARMPFKGSFQLEYPGNIPTAEVEALVKRFKESQGKDLWLLKKRYARMKQFGREQMKRIKQQGGSPRITGPKVGRNDPCPCGSGKKYKKCCGAAKS